MNGRLFCVYFGFFDRYKKFIKLKVLKFQSSFESDVVMKKDDIKLVNTAPEQLAILEGWEQQAGVGEFILANSKEQHLVSMQEPTIQYLSVFQNERLVGFIILALEPNNTIEFRRIVIGHRGAGIGQLAIRAMEQYCFSTSLVSVFG